MPTIREIAKETGLSVSTVSIVLRGNVPKGRVSEETQKKIRMTAQKMGYQPNLSARRLRSGQENVRTLAVFWASDFRAPLMVRFLRGLQKAVLDSGDTSEFVIYPYHVGKLREALREPYFYNAAIVCNANKDDIAFLENDNIPVPVVLYNRHSQTILNVCVDNVAMGVLPAAIFTSRGHRHAVMITNLAPFMGMEEREQRFTQEVINNGLSIRLLRVEASMEGGYQAAQAIAAMEPRPDCVFCLHDALAIGALKGFASRGVRVPEDIELISVGNGDKDLEEYASTSLSVVHLPMERMAAECLRLALSSSWGQSEGEGSVMLPVVYRCRESCGPMIEPEAN
ncbi:MAG TPA: LacI family DNA-binding transcriptional regulator [Candidatus Limiplasma sp.]|mgnify:CR=1 FL=1|nr:LacI family DNA-binding transcriptional regulator [Candidatus Limiplasma sp.]